jgi:hypothetical protein
MKVPSISSRAPLVASLQSRARHVYRALVPWAILGAFAVVGLNFARFVTGPVFVGFVLAGCAAAAVVIVVTSSPRAVMIGAFVFLAGLGMFRRILDYVLGATSVDPLLLLAPGVAVILIALAFQHRRLRVDSGLAAGVLALNVMAIGWAINPFSGAVIANVVALLFVCAPLLWFWVAKAYVDDRLLRSLFIVVAVAAVAVGLYGARQALSGFFPFDQAWVDANPDFQSLAVDGVTRPFSTFASPAEYTGYLVVGLVIWLFLLRRVPLAVRIAIGALLLVFLFQVGSLGPFVLLTVSVVAVVAARRGSKASLALVPVLALGALALLSLLANQVNTDSLESQSTGVFSTRVVQGFADPGENSTIDIHMRALLVGVETPLEAPFGYGPATVSLAGVNYGASKEDTRSAAARRGESDGGSRGGHNRRQQQADSPSRGNVGSTEQDLGNAAKAFGFPGLVAYLVVLVAGLLKAFRVLSWRRDALSMAAFALLIATFGSWLNGGVYALAPIPWLVLGWADAQRRPPPPEEQSASATLDTGGKSAVPRLAEG